MGIIQQKSVPKLLGLTSHSFIATFASISDQSDELIIHGLNSMRLFSCCLVQCGNCDNQQAYGNETD